ncbi:MAG: hypothetical protein ACKOKH_04910, partial [Bacteroidota bacterium]
TQTEMVESLGTLNPDSGFKVPKDSTISVCVANPYQNRFPNAIFRGIKKNQPGGLVLVCFF